MTNLLWPGDHRAGDLMSDESLLRNMIAVESAWLHALIAHGVAPADADTDLGSYVGAQDREALAIAAEDGGNPAGGLVEMLRERAPSVTAVWLHRGLTSQDVVDSALCMATRDVLDRLKAILLDQISVLAALIDTHRRTPMIARTLGQHAVPSTFASKAAMWLGGILDACDRLGAVQVPVQIGGAAGTLAASTELARLRNLAGDPARTSVDLASATAAALRLDISLPWHTNRAPVTLAADAFVGCSDAWGRIASDVITLSRPEIGELSEGDADRRGGSSTMPQKRNPVLAVLVKRAAIAAPPLAATLHIAAALANDERPDGAWHAEWDTMRVLARRTVVAGLQCRELLAGLEIHPDRMSAHVEAGISAEQQSMADLAGQPPSATYTGATDLFVDAVLERARTAGKDDA